MLSYSFGPQKSILLVWRLVPDSLFKFSPKPPRASGAWRHLHPVTAFRLGLLWHLSDTFIHPRAPALTPAPMLHLTNPCAEPKGSQPNWTQRHEPKSLGYSITLLMIIQLGLKKPATGTKFFTYLDYYQNQDNSKPDQRRSLLKPIWNKNNKNKKKKKWFKKDCKKKKLYVI